MKIDGLEIEIQKKRIKNYHIYVKAPDSAVLVTVPLRASESSIRSFVSERMDWIRKSRDDVRNRADKRSEIRKYLYTADSRIEVSDKEYSDKELSALLRERIGLRLPVMESLCGISCKSISIRRMKTRWGSCTPKTGAIRINLDLIHYPDSCLDYILLHELLHIRVPNHGPKFRALMTKYMPDWKERRKMLR